MEQAVAQPILTSVLGALNNSKLFAAAIMIVSNMSSKYISMDLCNFHEKIFSNFIVRKIALFAIFWMATRDIILSLILTLIFSIVMGGLLNEKSRFCIIPNKEQFMQKEDKKITDQEYENAQKIVKSYTEQMNNKNNKNNLSATEHFQNETHNKNIKQKNIYKINKYMLQKSQHQQNIKMI